MGFGNKKVWMRKSLNNIGVCVQLFSKKNYLTELYELHGHLLHRHNHCGVDEQWAICILIMHVVGKT